MGWLTLWWSVLLLGVIGTHCAYEVHRGVIVQNHGPAVIVNEYVLININASIIYENEKNLESLYDILMRLKTEVNTPNLQSVVKDLIYSVAEELPQSGTNAPCCHLWEQL